MENATSFPIEKDDNKSHSIMDVPGVIKEDNSYAIQQWLKSIDKLKYKASSRNLGMCSIIITIRFCIYDYYISRHL